MLKFQNNLIPHLEKCCSDDCSIQFLSAFKSQTKRTTFKTEGIKIQKDHKQEPALKNLI